MELSLFLGKVLGLYFFIAGLAIFCNRAYFEKMEKEFLNSPTCIFFGTFMGLIFGLLIVVGHNVWEFSWVFVITFVGWLSVIRALFFLFAYDRAFEFMKKLVKSPQSLTIRGAIGLVLGLIMLWGGFFS